MSEYDADVSYGLCHTLPIPLVVCETEALCWAVLDKQVKDYPGSVDRDDPDFYVIPLIT